MCKCITDRKWLEYFMAHNDIQSTDDERLTVVNLSMIVMMHCNDALHVSVSGSEIFKIQ